MIYCHLRSSFNNAKFSRFFTFQMQRFKGYHTRLADEIELFENIKILIVKARIYFFSCILVILNTAHQLLTFCSRILGIYSIKLNKLQWNSNNLLHWKIATADRNIANSLKGFAKSFSNLQS